MQRHFAGALFGATFLAAVAAIAPVAAPSAQAQLLPISIELGDVSLTKLPFVMAAEAGIYRRNGLDANVPEQFWRLAPPPRGWEPLAELI